MRAALCGWQRPLGHSAQPACRFAPWRHYCTIDDVAIASSTPALYHTTLDAAQILGEILLLSLQLAALENESRGPDKA